MNSNTNPFLAVVFAVLVALSPALALAQEPAEPAPAPSPEAATRQNLGYGFGSVVASLFYSPVKVTYAGLGLLTGGVGYLLSAGSTDVANDIIFPAVKGDYVITPSHLKGEERVVFVGAPPPAEPAPAPEPAATTAPTER